MRGAARPTGRLYAVLTSVVVAGLTVVALLALQWRSLDRFEQAAAQVLENAGVHAVDVLADEIARDFKSPIFNLIEQLDHDAARELRLDALASALDRRLEYGRLVDRVFVWSRIARRAPNGRGRPDEQVFFYSMRPGEREDSSAGVAPPARRFFEEPDLSAALLAHARGFASIFANFALARTVYRGRTYELVFHLLYNWPDRRHVEAILGFAIDEQRLRDRYFAGLLSSSQGQALLGTHNLSISIVDDRGEEVFRTGGSLRDHYDAQATFPYLFYDVDLVESLNPFKPEVRYWSVRASLGGSSVTALVRRQTATQRLLVLFAGAVALAGIALTLRTATREVRLARMKSDFLAGVSHELKTPLAKILLFADTLSAGRARSPDKLAEYSRIIGSQARLLDQQLSDILRFARIDAGRREYGADPLDLRQVLEGAVSGFGPTLDERGFAVQVTLPDSEVPVVGDADALRQAFDNVIANAIKYSIDARSLRIALAAADGHARAEFCDRGIGIAPRHQKEIFDRFVRIRQPGTSRIGGTGLGLTIASHVVRAHRGRITVRSAPGEGSTFVITLPLRREGPREGAA